MRTVIKDGIVVQPGAAFRTSLAFENGVITEVGAVNTDNAEVINAYGCIVLPGGVDVHTHVDLALGENLRVSDGFYHGTLAAAYGGTTCIVEHISSGPRGCSLSHMPEVVLARAQGEAVVDFGLHGVFQSADDAALAGIEAAMSMGCTTFKAYMTYADRQDDTALLRILAALVRHKGLLTVHAEHHEVIAWLTEGLRRKQHCDPTAHPLARPDYTEAEAVYRLVQMAGAVDAPVYVVHLSTAHGLESVSRARAQGRPVMAETCPQYLLLDANAYAEPDGLCYVMSPPLRTRADARTLWDGLNSGTVQVVATDHCSFTLAQKQALGGNNVFTCPGGIPGVETRLPLLFSEGVLQNRLTLERMAEVTSSNPARIMGLRKKGVLAPGMDADVVILDPGEERLLSAQTLHHRADFTPFAGMTVRGWPRDVWVRGARVIENQQHSGLRSGAFVKRELPVVI